MVGARKAAESEAPAVRASLERLARRAGIVAPKLYLINDPFPRSLAAGRGATGSTVALSTGLVATASPAELEGILAHEVAHVARRDVVVQTVAVLVAATLVELTRIGGFLQRALLFVLAPVASAFLHLLLSSRRELQADRVAARTLRVAARPGGRAAAARPGRRAGRPRRRSRHRAAVHRQPVPARTACGALRHAPAGGRAGAAAARARPGLARDATRRRLANRAAIPETRRAPRGRSSESNSAATYSPGRLPSEYHRRRRA